jgi:hypothetical protein
MSGAVSRRLAGFLPFSIRAAIYVLDIFIGRRTQNLNFAGRLSSVSSTISLTDGRRIRAAIFTKNDYSVAARINNFGLF